MAGAVTCRVCGAVKPAGEFYPRQVRKCGTIGECKECTKSRVRGHRAVNDNVRAYDRERSRTPKRRAHIARVSKEWREKNPEGYKAHTAVGNALRDGKLFRQPCEVCGANDNLHAHHHDYSKPLDVTWLCAAHHHRHHSPHQGAANG